MEKESIKEVLGTSFLDAGLSFSRVSEMGSMDYHRGLISCDVDGIVLEIRIYEEGKQGSQIGSICSGILHTWHPHFIFMSGVCAGNREVRELDFAHLLIAPTVYLRDPDKIDSEGVEKHIISSLSMESEVLRLSNIVREDGSWKEKAIKYIRGEELIKSSGQESAN